MKYQFLVWLCGDVVEFVNFFLLIFNAEKGSLLIIKVGLKTFMVANVRATLIFERESYEINVAMTLLS